MAWSLLLGGEPSRPPVHPQTGTLQAGSCLNGDEVHSQFHPESTFMDRSYHKGCNHLVL